MIDVTDKSKCCGCHACATICPKGCIRMKPDEEGFLYPYVNIEQCVECSFCERVCPMNTAKKDLDERIPVAYAVINKNLDIRWNSSSGGVFSLLAEYVIENNGIVFGAAFDPDFNVIHMPITDREDIPRLRGSKYVQSRIGDSYKLAKEFLESGKRVLFTGTPCQISGLKKYLQRDYENLITQDLVCHGVPSPDVWRRYLDFQQEHYGVKPKAISFRKKKEGEAEGYFITIIMEDGQIYEKPAYEDAYMRAFFDNYSLRHSCYSCENKGLSRVSDITLADYWGVDNIHPDINDKKGVSLVWVNSEKGKRIFEQLKDKIDYRVSDVETAVKYNYSAVRSVPKPLGRDMFMKDIKSSANFAKVVRNYCKEPTMVWIKRKIKRCLRIVLKTVKK